MPERLLIATTNQHKLEEIAAILAAAGCTLPLLGLSSLSGYTEPAEDGDSFAANAEIKAVSAAKAGGCITLADDSGLCVEALGGAPGLLSARYADDQQTQHNNAANRRKLLRELAGLPPEQRRAAFVCAVCVAVPQADAPPRLYHLQGRCEGVIGEREKGEHGFGYDSLFYMPQYGRTMAELPPQIKNSVSHRARAIRQAAVLLAKL
ncbi:MAG: RdgB/HAM1 family non-canonical purine NTP pyrophosphatase [Bacillota bacterium]|nr:RdgB/HAM1 family non-canonical purine NTP pyrophosphatase [Bacillota bacterium]